MKRVAVLLIAMTLIVWGQAYGYQSLQEVFDNAGPGNGYDKYVVLDPAIEYEGDLTIDNAGYVGIVGNGANIYVIDATSGIYIQDSQVDISECCITVANEQGLRVCIFYGVGSCGIVHNNTIVNGTYTGIRCKKDHQTDPGITIYDNIITDCLYGILADEYYLPVYVGYNIVFNSTKYDYAEKCDS